MEQREGVLDEGDSDGRDNNRILERIRFDDGEVSIRGAYHWKRHPVPGNAWAWGSQTSFSPPIDLFEKLID